ncbi:MAG TPA: hypothetical protein VEA41_05535, partial [Salinarimonas sp.]|nr:hypothetical protein [Salinarimonas sp.]
MAATNITVTSADVFLAEVWSRKSFKAAEFATEIADTVNRSFEAEMKFGDVLHIPVISNMTAGTKSADTAVAVEAITETKTDVSINVHKYVAFRLERIVAVQANQNLMEQYTAKIGYPLQRAVDSGIAAIFDTLATTVGTLGVELTWDDYRTAWQKMREAGVGEGNLNGGSVTWMLSP